MNITIKEVEKWLIDDIVAKFGIDRRKAKRLLLESLLRKSVLNEIFKVIEFLISTQINKR